MKAIEDVQQLDPNPMIARANSMNKPLAGSRETPMGMGKNAKEKHKEAMMAAIRQRLQGKK